MDKDILIASLLKLRKKVMRKKQVTSLGEPVCSREIEESLREAVTREDLLNHIVGNISGFYTACGIGIAKLLASYFSKEELLSHRLYVNPSETELSVEEYAIVLLDKSVKRIHLTCDSGYVSIYSDGWTKTHLSGDTVWYLMGYTYGIINDTRVQLYDFSHVEGTSDKSTTLTDYGSCELDGDGLIEAYSYGEANGKHMVISCGCVDERVNMEGVQVEGYVIQKDLSQGFAQVTIHYGGQDKIVRKPWKIRSNNYCETHSILGLRSILTDHLVLPAHYEPLEEVKDIISQLKAFLKRNDLEDLLPQMIPQGDISSVDREMLLRKMKSAERSFVRFLSAGGGEVLRRCFHIEELIEENIHAFDGGYISKRKEGAMYVLSFNQIEVSPGEKAYFFEYASGYVESGYAEFHNRARGITRDSYVRTFGESTVYSLNGKNEAYGQSAVSPHGFNATACYEKATVIDYGDPVEITMHGPEAKRNPPIMKFPGFENAIKLQ